MADATLDIRRTSSLVETGDRAFKSGNTAKAQKSFRKALAVIPGYPAAHLGLGHVAMSEARFEDALAEYTAAEKGYGDLSDIMLDLESKRYGRAQREMRELEDQIRVINDVTLKVSDGTRRSKTLQLEERIRALRGMEYPKQEQVYHPPAELYFHVGNALFRLGRAEQALANWETCVAKAPRFPLVHNNLAVVYMQQGRLDEALRSLSRAEELGVTVNPDFKADLLRRTAHAEDLRQRP